MDVIGNKFFQLLLRNSLLQDVKLDEHNITHCKMHDLVHDLAGDIGNLNYFIQRTMVEKIFLKCDTLDGTHRVIK